MIHPLKLPILLGLIACIPSQTSAETPENRVWFTWERQRAIPQLCEQKNHCTPIREFITRLIEEPETQKAEQMTGSLDRLIKMRKQPVEHPEAPNWCAHTDAQKILGFDAEHWPLAEKLVALRGLEGVYINVEGLKGPANFEGPFGPKVQATIARKFRENGIKLLTEEEMEQTPGKPHMNIYFSNTNPDTGCWFSVFSSVSQTMLLTRNHTIKVKAGSWGFSGGYSADHPDRAEFDAIMLVVDRFISDFKTANSTAAKSDK
ncbi:hypothetical protein GCM10007939_20430 [Amylibacter marinus]|uniref:Secreted protein n=1 Tax=Amylibacter marinus TaxID=1475483 RepID=A0ABQ5VWN0_9RHOB|nr:hypothetical protein [Amylibacter marinus]GLQ35760.1 hypothetical protein GCM10007939_20430 [Amylibacter marinus]